MSKKIYVFKKYGKFCTDNSLICYFESIGEIYQWFKKNKKITLLDFGNITEESFDNDDVVELFNEEDDMVEGCLIAVENWKD